ncbi:MAG: hypothetical protein H6719_06600 [Sandaracinaceae bacterium]|nr:hypothetical protein [Sandaracinaceae bacterium]
MRAGSQAAVEREVMDVARALHRRGSVAESVALLRAAVCRDGGQAATRLLLDQALAGAEVGAPSATVELGYGLVDGWIRRGMLVEALALLSGTSLGSRDKGREWATLLGELLAPVPVDAEDSLRQAYRQLMTGGASVALTLLDERDRKSPALPAWARRRLEVLRWLLLDNAEVLEDRIDSSDVLAPSELAAALGALKRKGLLVGLATMKEFAEQHPDHGDAQRVLDALETLVANLEEEASRIGSSNQTMPMVGHVAAMMQLRMGNLQDAVPMYEKLIRTKDDERARVLLGEVELLLRVLDGQPLDEPDELAGESTQMRQSDPFGDEPTVDDYPGGGGATMEIRLPEWPEEASVEESGKIAVGELSGLDAIEGGATTQQPSADQHAERLVAQGRLEEAQQIYLGLLEVWPDREEWVQRAEELGRMCAERRAATGGVLVRVILPVK